MTISEFLSARIAEREVEVSKYGTEVVAHSVGCIYEGGYEGTAMCDCGAIARTLAECEAKRRIIEWGLPVVDIDGDPQQDDDAAFVFRTLALAYADHPDYREDWRP